MTTSAKNRAEFLAECRSGRFDGVVAIYRTFPSIDVTGRIDEELVAALPRSVRFICHNGGWCVLFADGQRAGAGGRRGVAQSPVLRSRVDPDSLISYPSFLWTSAVALSRHPSFPPRFVRSR
jgi:hypothetical protein